MSEDVVLGGARFSWLQNLSDAEILRWPELPPSFPDDIDIIRDQVRGELGAVDVPPTWDGAHSEIRRLLRTDAGRQERQRGTSVVFAWEAPRFDSPIGQRKLRILNAVFLGVVRAGGKGQVGDGNKLETSVVVHGSPVAFRLTALVPETKKSKCGGPLTLNQADRLRLSILDVHGSKPERVVWEDGEARPLEARITDIAVELVTTAEINYRQACMRRHLWVAEKREALKARLDDERRTAEIAKVNHTAAVAKARLDNLVAMATDYRQARAIRVFVSAMRRRSPDADGTMARSDFEDWCHWALAQADELDPIKNLARFLIESK